MRERKRKRKIDYEGTVIQLKKITVCKQKKEETNLVCTTLIIN